MMFRRVVSVSIATVVWISTAFGFDSIPEDDLGQQMFIQARSVSSASNAFAIPSEVMVYKAVQHPLSPDLLSSLAGKHGFHQANFNSPLFDSATGIYFAGSEKPLGLSYQPTIGLFTMTLTNSLGYNYDKDSRKYSFGELISEKAALQQSLEMLPSVGLSTNDFYVAPDTGRLFYKPTGRFLGYTDKETHEHKRVQIEREIWLWRQIDGYKVYGFGGGGGAKFRFVYQTLAQVDWLFRGKEPYKKMPLIGRSDILKAVRKNKCYGWKDGFSCEKLTVSKVDLQYYEGNSFGRQRYFLPVFSITCKLDGASNGEKEIELLLPALK